MAISDYRFLWKEKEEYEANKLFAEVRHEMKPFGCSLCDFNCNYALRKNGRLFFCGRCKRTQSIVADTSFSETKLPIYKILNLMELMRRERLFSYGWKLERQKLSFLSKKSGISIDVVGRYVKAIRRIRCSWFPHPRKSKYYLEKLVLRKDIIVFIAVSEDGELLKTILAIDNSYKYIKNFIHTWVGDDLDITILNWPNPVQKELLKRDFKKVNFKDDSSEERVTYEHLASIKKWLSNTYINRRGVKEYYSKFVKNLFYQWEDMRRYLNDYAGLFNDSPDVGDTLKRLISHKVKYPRGGLKVCKMNCRKKVK